MAMVQRKGRRETDGGRLPSFLESKRILRLSRRSPPKLPKSSAPRHQGDTCVQGVPQLPQGRGGSSGNPTSSPPVKIPGEGVLRLSQQQTLLDKPGQLIQRPGQQADRKGESLRAKQEKNREGQRKARETRQTESVANAGAPGPGSHPHTRVRARGLNTGLPGCGRPGLCR